MFSAAAEQQRAWRADDLTLAINVSFRQLLDEAFVERVRDRIRSSGADPARLELELTETWVMRDPEAARARLRPLRDLGLRIAIDDFGTGYSNLATLSELPVDTIKIDRQFVTNVERNTVHQAIVHSLRVMAEGIHLGIVAEGIESEAERVWLSEHGVHLAQGYLFSKPLPVPEFEAWHTAVKDRARADDATSR